MINDTVLYMFSLFQKKMGKSKEKEKMKRLFEDSPNNKPEQKLARKSPPEDQNPGMKLEPASTQELMDELFCENLPSTPAKLDSQEAQEDMVIGTPKQAARAKIEPEKEKGGRPIPRLESQEDDFLPVSQLGEPVKETLDWKIPPAFRMEWIAARVEQLMIAMDIIGGMFSPIFIVQEVSPVKVKEELAKPVAEKKETLSFFKSRIKRRPAQVASGDTVGARQVLIFAREPVRDSAVKVIRALNQGQRDPRIASYLDMLELLQKAKEQNNSFASKAAGGPDYNKLWEYAVRKLVWFTTEEWNMPTASPVFPLIREVDPDTGSIKIHATLLNRYEEMLFQSLMKCGDEAGKQRALEYWAHIVSTFGSITGKIILVQEMNVTKSNPSPNTVIMTLFCKGGSNI